MKKLWTALLILALTLTCAAQAEGTSLTAISVGKGDALLLEIGSQRYLIDAGRPWAWGRLRSALGWLGVTRLDGVILTHTDKDHAGGMALLADSDIEVDAWYAASIFADPKKESKHPLVKAAALRGQTVRFLDAGDAIPCDGGTITVLAPFSEDSENENNNSLVLYAETGDGTMLLTGDMELEEEAQLLASGARVAADVLKVPHHGEDDATSDALAQAVSAKAAVISTDTVEEPDTPDPVVMAALERAGSEVYVTQDAEVGVRVTLSGGTVAAEYVGYPSPLPEQRMVKMSVRAKPDAILLENPGAEAIDLTGWYLYADNGEDAYLFPNGASLPASGSLGIATQETDMEGDLFWDIKNAVSNKKEDIVFLYDSYGRCIEAVWTYGAE